MGHLDRADIHVSVALQKAVGAFQLINTEEEYGSQPRLIRREVENPTGYSWHPKGTSNL